MSSHVITSKSLALDQNSFAEKFATAQDILRVEPYRLGILPPGIWKSFLSMPSPFPTEFWIAENQGQVVGRIGANVSASYPGTGFIGFFECEGSSSKVAAEMLRVAREWLKSKGVTKIFGPMNFNTWFPYRFRADTDDLRFSWEPVHPPEHLQFFLDSGFKVFEKYHSQAQENLETLIAATKPSYQAALEKGYRFRPFDVENLLSKEVKILYDISMPGFKDNFLFEPIPFEVFRQLYVPIANKIDMSTSYFALNPQGKEVAFLFSFQDGEYQILKSIATHPEVRGLGLSNGVFYLSVSDGLRKGTSKIVHAMIKSGAQSESYAKKAAKLWRHEYVLLSQEV